MTMSGAEMLLRRMDLNSLIGEQMTTLQSQINAKSRLQAFVASVKDAFAPKAVAMAVAA